MAKRKLRGRTSKNKRARKAGDEPEEKKKRSRKKTRSASTTGADGFNRAREDQQRRDDEYERRSSQDYRFRITVDDIKRKKNEVELVYLDEEPFFVREHSVKNSQGYWDNEVCIADTGEACPLCSSLGKTGTYTLMLSAIDRRHYKKKDGSTVKVSRKLVAVKGKNIPKYERYYKKHGTFRGMKVVHIRTGDKENSIGEDLTFEPKRVSEKSLKKLKALSQPADYQKAFPTPSADELRKRYSMSGPAGAPDDDDDDADLDDVDW